MKFWSLCAAALLAAMATQCVAQNRDTLPKGWKSRYARANGIQIHYVEAGKGKTVLFLHGFPEFWYAWKNQIAALSAHYRTVAMDMRGYNLSEKPPNVEDYAISTLIADVKAMVDHLGKGKKVVLVAHDWGGAIAWGYAAAHPETLEKLVIINAPHPTVFARELQSNPKQQAASAYMNMFRSPQAESILSANNYAALVSGVLKGTSKPNVFSEEDIKAYLKAWAQPGALTGGLNYYRAAKVGPPAGNAQPEQSALAQMPPVFIQVPTLVIWGEKDSALLTGNLEGLEKYVPQLTIRRIPQGSHWVIHEEPEIIHAAIRAFIEEGNSK
jgi:pimeloyl-ACP methyl ester carboxylesterase